MQAVLDTPNLLGRRLTGAVLRALLVAAIVAPITTSIVREFSAVDGSGALLLTLAIVVLLTLFNFTLGRWPAYVGFWGGSALPHAETV